MNFADIELDYGSRRYYVESESFCRASLIDRMFILEYSLLYSNTGQKNE
jgi:hypothetical protein